jgi:hypothetical protein
VKDQLQRCIAQVRFRAERRRWEYRQRNLAKGTWHRFRCLLAQASEAFVIDAEEAARLVAEGHAPEPVGRELEPPKQIFFLPEDRLRRLVRATSVPVRLDAAMLAARALALRRFDP